MKSRKGTQFWPQPPKVSHGGGCAERAPVTCASSNPVRASATLPEYVPGRTPSVLGVVYVGTLLRSASALGAKRRPMARCGRHQRASVWSWRSDWSGCFLFWLPTLAVLRAEWAGAAAAVAETWSGGGPWPPARAARRRRAALIQ